MNFDPELRRRLVKDFQLPIGLYDDENYGYLKNLYDNFFKITEKEDMMKEVLLGLLKEKGLSVDEASPSFCKSLYLDYAATVSNRLKEIVRATASFDRLNAHDYKNDFKPVEGVNIYVPENLDRDLISIDLSKANFNAMGLLGLKMELNIETFEDFMELATPYEYFKKSKMIRQVVFGDLAPKKQQNIQKRVIAELAKALKDTSLVLKSSSADELIVEPPKDGSINAYDIEKLLKERTEPYYHFFRVEEFRFTKVFPMNDGMDYLFKTSRDTNGVIKEEFKNTPVTYFPQVFKEKFNIPLEKRDLYFKHDGKMCAFLETLASTMKYSKDLTLK